MFPLQQSLYLVTVLSIFIINPTYADGPVGEHVNDLQGHLDEYTLETTWLINQVREIVDSYEDVGLEGSRPEMVVDHWEAVKFHSAIESNYIPLYASIWQSLFGVRTSIEKEDPIEKVHVELEKLEQVLWQSLGAVKLAAQYQDQGLLQVIQTREAISPTAILIEVKQRLDRVVAKYAETLSDEAIKITQETYLERFEEVENLLSKQDAKLVEDLELDFNVRLPQAIQDGRAVDDVRGVVLGMKGKLDRARYLLKKLESNT